MITNKTRMRVAAAALLTLGAWAAGPSLVRARPPGLRVMGATSLVGFLTDSARRYAAQYPRRPLVHVAPGGSLAGLYQVVRGAVELAASDVPPREVLGAEAGRIDGVALGRLPVVLVAHAGVGLARVTPREARALLVGQVRSWQELGGAAENVVVVTRAPGSGARWVVEHQLLAGTPFSNRAVVQWSNGAVLRTVMSTPGSIGFVDAGFVRPGVVVLGLGPYTYQPQRVGAWPLYAVAGLYWRKGAPSAVVAFARFAASEPSAERYGIFKEAPADGLEHVDRGVPPRPPAVCGSGAAGARHGRGLGMAGDRYGRLGRSRGRSAGAAGLPL